MVWPTRAWTLGASVSDEQLDELLVVARERLAEFSAPDGCVLGIAAKVARWPA